jgi:hypothetical protein
MPAAYYNGKVTMSETAVVLLSIQTALLLALVVVMWMVKSALQQSAEKANALMADLHATLENDLKPAIADARNTLQRTEGAAQAAAKVLNAAEPVVSSASQVAAVFQKSTAPLWLDAAKLAMGIVGVLRSRRKETDEPPSKEN